MTSLILSAMLEKLSITSANREYIVRAVERADKIKSCKATIVALQDQCDHWIVDKSGICQICEKEGLCESSTSKDKTNYLED